MGTWIEKQVGFLLVLVSVGWAIYYFAHESSIQRGFLRLGPMQLFLLGLLLWLHGKFRHSVNVNRT